jgi:hypothetical protein
MPKAFRNRPSPNWCAGMWIPHLSFPISNF